MSITLRLHYATLRLRHSESTMAKQLAFYVVVVVVSLGICNSINISVLPRWVATLTPATPPYLWPSHGNKKVRHFVEQANYINETHVQLNGT